jgi:hypothetical protein
LAFEGAVLQRQRLACARALPFQPRQRRALRKALVPHALVLEYPLDGSVRRGGVDSFLAEFLSELATSPGPESQTVAHEASRERVVVQELLLLQSVEAGIECRPAEPLLLEPAPEFLFPPRAVGQEVERPLASAPTQVHFQHARPVCFVQDVADSYAFAEPHFESKLDGGAFFELDSEP